MEHVRDDLSAHLDGALAPARRSAVDAHLATCPTCRNRLAELRSTARLIAGLPAAVPSRRLVPALAPRTSWVRLLRSFSAVAAGAFVLLFMASATLDTGFRMGGGGTSPSSGRLIGGPTPAAAALEAAPRTDTASVPAPGSVPLAAASASPGPQDSADAQGRSTQSTLAPKVAVASASPAEQLRVVYGHPPAPLSLGTPWLWLSLALVSTALAVVAHRRLRAR